MTRFKTLILALFSLGLVASVQAQPTLADLQGVWSEHTADLTRVLTVQGSAFSIEVWKDGEYSEHHGTIEQNGNTVLLPEGDDPVVLERLSLTGNVLSFVAQTSTVTLARE